MSRSSFAKHMSLALLILLIAQISTLHAQEIVLPDIDDTEFATELPVDDMAGEVVVEDTLEDPEMINDRRIAFLGQQLNEASVNVDKANAALAEGDYQKAVQFLVAAETIYQNLSRTKQSVRDDLEKTQSSLADVYRQWADSLLKAGQLAADNQLYDEASDNYQKALEKNPEMRPYIRERLKDLEYSRDFADFQEQTDVNNVDPELNERTRDVQVLLAQGKVFMSNRRYMDAREKFEQVMILDPSNVEASRLVERIYEELGKVADARRHSMIRERMAEIGWKWVEPVAPLERPGGPSPAMMRDNKSPRATDSIREKLERIVIPKLEFTDATIETVIDQLRLRAQELDVEGKGVNFIYRPFKEEAPLQDDGLGGDFAPAPDPFSDEFGAGDDLFSEAPLDGGGGGEMFVSSVAAEYASI